MMKTQVMAEKRTCDLCGSSDSVYHECFGCGKDICWECSRDSKNAVQYYHGTHVQGSGDGYYCNECDRSLANDPLHKSYVAIQELRDEADRFYPNWEARRRVAEAECARLYDRRKEASR